MTIFKGWTAGYCGNAPNRKRMELLTEKVKVRGTPDQKTVSSFEFSVTRVQTQSRPECETGCEGDSREEVGGEFVVAAGDTPQRCGLDPKNLKPFPLGARGTQFFPACFLPLLLPHL